MKEVHTDFLIIGSGIAGLSGAIKLAEQGTVAVVSKREFLEGSTVHAQGGIASVSSPEDSFQQHIDDTLRAGAGLCNEDVVRAVVEEGPDRIKDLESWGMSFAREERNGDQTYDLGL